MSQLASRRVTICNSQGLHARPSAALMKLATEFGSEITIRNLGNGVEASARALLEIMMLNAPQGTELELEAEGEDAAAAVEALAELIERGFGEG